jgi:hypothetical protein
LISELFYHLVLISRFSRPYRCSKIKRTYYSSCYISALRKSLITIFSYLVSYLINFTSIISAVKIMISSSRNVWRKIVLAIKKLSNKFLKYESKSYISSFVMFLSKVSKSTLFIFVILYKKKIKDIQYVKCKNPKWYILKKKCSQR